MTAPRTIWLTGLSGAGKSTLATELYRALSGQGVHCFVLDGDQLRKGLARGLGFSPADRMENIRRAAEAARLLNQAGVTVIGAFISPCRADRAMARDIVGAAAFVEVYLNTPLAVCEARDPKGLYARVRAGEIAQFTGISAPYEAPAQAAVTVDTTACSVADASRAVLQTLAAGTDPIPAPPDFSFCPSTLN